jgi:cyclic-di-GMP-binding protein
MLQIWPVRSTSVLVAEFSFDVVSEYNGAELTNALDQARREVMTRFDFKDTATVFDHRGEMIVIESASEDRARAALQVLREKAARRQLSPKLFKAGDPKTVGKARGQIEVQLNAGITDDIARDLRKRIQSVSNKLQVRIQGDQLRVVSKDKDTLQAVMKTLREAEDIPVPLQFTNYR